MITYLVQRASQPPPQALLSDEAHASFWHEASSLSVANFRPESSDHHPQTQACFLYQEQVLYGLFSVDDRFVRCVNTGFQSRTHRDTCVEVFLQPRPDLGYFNFEFNCGGALAVFYITDPTRTADLFKEYVKLSPSDVAGMQIESSLPQVIEPEISTPINWRLGFKLPLSALEKYTGALGALPGSTWRANVYKCADETSHPHWAAWSAVPELNFHLPAAFGEFRFQA